MSKKKICVEIVFEEITEDDDTYLEPVVVRRGKSTNLTNNEMDALGESVAQSDFWQVDRWIDIQMILAGKEKIVVGKGRY